MNDDEVLGHISNEIGNAFEKNHYLTEKEMMIFLLLKMCSTLQTLQEALIMISDQISNNTPR